MKRFIVMEKLKCNGDYTERCENDADGNCNYCQIHCDDDFCDEHKKKIILK